MADLRRCDHCRSETTNRAWHDQRWLELALHTSTDSDYGHQDCTILDFCSWRCLAEYAAARQIMQPDSDQAGR